MGSFSWLKADDLTNVANIVCDKPFKLLIPKEFGGGFIKDNYQDYGSVGCKEDGSEKYDIYELLAFWNADMDVRFTISVFDFEKHEYETYPPGTKIRDMLKYDGLFPAMKEIDKYTDFNRSIGIDIGCYDKQIDTLKYPPKLVSASYKGSYEECVGKSYGDPNQGGSPIYRNRNNKISV